MEATKFLSSTSTLRPHHEVSCFSPCSLGMMAVVALSVAISTGVLFFQAVEMAKIILFEFHLM
ncbi:hypothetical protein Patl1_21371 [Pistacia atlantica]|uniref:Uncharacterized protein n=1 Tax=Pistacia atlantica TaxID=434234 RepID=A0ACC1BM22_9ROSI|nr:hypothetical protein Patl1_21371 [Pistacia atlantica]